MIEALLEATRDHLIDELDSLTRDDIGVRPDGKPPATMGDVYVSVDEASVQSAERGSLKEAYAVTVWATIRSGVFPSDRLDEAYLAQARRLTGLERAIIAAVHGDQDLRALANSLLVRDSLLGSGEFGHPLYYLGRPKTIKTSDWILGDSPEQPTPCMVRQLNFAGGIRLQNLANFT